MQIHRLHIRNCNAANLEGGEEKETVAKNEVIFVMTQHTNHGHRGREHDTDQRIGNGGQNGTQFGDNLEKQ